MRSTGSAGGPAHETTPSATSACAPDPYPAVASIHTVTSDLRASNMESSVTQVYTEYTPAEMQGVFLASLECSGLQLASNLHMAWLDRYLSHVSNGKCALRDVHSHPSINELAELCAVLVDSAKTGDAREIGPHLLRVKYPHYLRSSTSWSGGYIRSTSVIGQLHDMFEVSLPVHVRV